MSIRIIMIAIALMSGACGAMNPALPPAPVHAAQTEYRYLLGPSDQLEITVQRHPELTAKLPIRPDGRITLQLIEDVVAIGKSATELAREIEQRLSKFVRDPAVTVMVSHFVGNSNEQVRVVGQATKPAALPDS